VSAVGIAAVLFGVLVLVPVSLVLVTTISARRVQHALPWRGVFVQIGGARNHWIARGSGPVILLRMRGLGGNAMHFTQSVLRLTAVGEPISDSGSTSALYALSPRARTASQSRAE
jgi:hypothetical protein